MKLPLEVMVEKQAVVVDAIKNKHMKKLIYIIFIYILLSSNLMGQEIVEQNKKSSNAKNYKKRVLESPEIDLLSSLYTQDGENAAVSGGIGTEDLQDATATIIVSIPINPDDVLVINAGVSAYSSASSSNVNPFDGRNQADAFVASSGESQSDVWSTGSISYSHSSDDRNRIVSLNANFATEYDYSSVGLGAAYSLLSNSKNTELSIKGSAFFDTWSLIYPAELRSFGLRGGDDDDDEDFNINNHTITGNPNYQPMVVPLAGRNRNSYAAGIGFSQILSKKLQGSLALDVVYQQGQLSTPFQRVYFADVANSFIENFHLADDIERLPSTRTKMAIGSRLNYYVNESLVIRSFYRFYRDDWKLSSHTASIELPIKVMMGQFSFYPSYRYYYQSGIAYFAPYDQHLSSSEFYTSDYDLSAHHAHQLGFGFSYSNVFGKGSLKFLELKGIDLKYYHYQRNSAFRSHLLSLGVKFSIF